LTFGDARSIAGPTFKIGGDMGGWGAILIILIFILAFGLLNRYEFGRFD
jgi:hypothetical protein